MRADHKEETADVCLLYLSACSHTELHALATYEATVGGALCS